MRAHSPGGLSLTSEAGLNKYINKSLNKYIGLKGEATLNNYINKDLNKIHQLTTTPHTDQSNIHEHIKNQKP